MLREPNLGTHLVGIADGVESHLALRMEDHDFAEFSDFLMDV
ncbi:hypothetical protein ADIMK_3387 [Marinobacterium lacunae]|uniref:Uncharacterized protein n=1 Tax=Marinobacterium lacunae TaxID=1232683 RepID=A0A081FVE1_9GAMM|nr:hypothetical protein ADIMK_3387 [Marinobacterium lacunae]